jgi:hypothetical protein
VTAKELIAVVDKLIVGEVTLVKNKKDHKAFLKNAQMPKALLFSKNKDVSRLIRSLAQRFAGRLQIGQIARTRESKVLHKHYSIVDLPTLMTLLPVGEGETYDKDMGPTLRTFSGKQDFESMQKFMRAYALPSDDDEELLPQLKDRSCFTHACVAPGGICVIAVISAHASVRQRTLTQLLTVASVRDARKDSKFHFSWVDGLTQNDFLSGFGLQPADYPQLVVYSHQKEKFSPLIGSFTEDTIGKFLGDTLTGATHTHPVTMPPFDNKTTMPQFETPDEDEDEEEKVYEKRVADAKIVHDAENMASVKALHAEAALGVGAFLTKGDWCANLEPWASFSSSSSSNAKKEKQEDAKPLGNGAIEGIDQPQKRASRYGLNNQVGSITLIVFSRSRFFLSIITCLAFAINHSLFFLFLLSLPYPTRAPVSRRSRRRLRRRCWQCPAIGWFVSSTPPPAATRRRPRWPPTTTTTKMRSPSSTTTRVRRTRRRARRRRRRKRRRKQRRRCR